MTVEILAGPVVPHCGARIGVPGGDLDVAQVHARVQHGRHECVPEHMRMRPGDRHGRLLREPPQPPGGGVPVHPRAAGVEQDRAPVRPPAARSIARPTAGGSGTRTILLPLPHTRSTR